MYKRVQIAEARIRVLESKTEELEDELHKQRGGKHDRRVLTKARLATAKYLTARWQARDEEKENKPAATSSKPKKHDCANSPDPERRQLLEPFENCLHNFQLDST